MPDVNRNNPLLHAHSLYMLNNNTDLRFYRRYVTQWYKLWVRASRWFLVEVFSKKKCAAVVVSWYLLAMWKKQLHGWSRYKRTDVAGTYWKIAPGLSGFVFQCNKQQLCVTSSKELLWTDRPCHFFWPEVMHFECQIYFRIKNNNNL